MNGEQGKGHGGKGEDASDAKVNAAADDDQRHSAGEDAVNGDGAEHIAVGSPFEEGAVGVEKQADAKDDYKSAKCPGGRGASIEVSVLIPSLICCHFSDLSSVPFVPLRREGFFPVSPVRGRIRR